MANAAIAFPNLSDAGSVAASTAIVAAPASTLQNPHVARKWRGTNGDTEFIRTSALTGFDTVLLRGLNLTSAGTTRVRVSSADSSGQAGDVFDSHEITGLVDEAFGTLLVLLPALVDGFVLIDMQEPGADVIEAGRLCVAPRMEFSVNFSWGWSEQWIDRSRETESRGGQSFIDPDVTYRSWNMQFGNLSRTERAVIQQLDRLNGTKRDFLMIKDTDSDTFGPDSLWGRVKQIDPILQPGGYRVDGGLISTKSFQMFERL